MDRMTPEQRHRCMSRIRSKDTKPERLVRHWLWEHGYRYRLNVKGVPGKPDIVMRKYRTAIFVNGCFWHGHGIEEIKSEEVESEEVKNSECCKIPKSNRTFWVNKIRRNQERDKKNYQILLDNGWQVIVIWECQLKPKKLEQTMLQVEVSLQDYYLRTFTRKAKSYIRLEEDEPLPEAAEEP
ncbi:MAG: very short patch repair endonuclease [Bacteroidales bacterium]|nr:very short patch repair endonuclease [Bacteroidales bacterium]